MQVYSFILTDFNKLLSSHRQKNNLEFFFFCQCLQNDKNIPKICLKQFNKINFAVGLVKFCLKKIFGALEIVSKLVIT